MNTSNIKLLLTTSPFLKDQEDTPYIMRQVIYSLVPAGLAGVFYFGFASLLVIAVCIGGAVGAEWLVSRTKGRNTVTDGTAILTGFLLALVLPPGIPLWMAFLGAVVSILVGKAVFGGIGSNIFNPALVGRAFLQASFPVAITTWIPQSNLSSFSQLRGHTLTLPFLKTQAAAVTSATPLAEMKFEGKLAAYGDLFLGNIAGSLGETSALLLLAGGVYLAIRNYLNWRIPASIFLSVFVFAGFLHWLNPQAYAPPLFHLLSGGLMLGAVFMATDPVTSPITQRGCWIFGIGIGFLVIIIRTFGGLPEGVMYAILLMNAFTPLINRVTQPPIYGAVKEKKVKEAK